MRLRSVVSAFALVIFVLLALAPAAAAQDAVPAGEATDEPADPELICDATASDDRTAEVGTTLTLDHTEVTVTGTSFEPMVQDFFSEGYLVVDFTLRNVSDEPYDYSGLWDWDLLDAAPGGISPTSLDPTSTMSDLTVGAGEEIEGHVTFPIGYGGGEFRVRYQEDGFFDGENGALWATSVEPSEDPGPVLDVPVITPVTDGFENVEAYDIDIVVNDDGSATFTETIDYDFGSLSRHGIYRDLDLRQYCNDRYDRIYPMSDVSVQSETAPDQFELENAGATRRIKIGDPDRTITGEHTYVVRYTLDGTLNGFPSHDELYWNVIGDRWGVQLANIDVTVSTPGDITEAACFAGEVGSRASCDEASIDGDGNAHFTQTYLGPYQAMSVVVAFPTGLVPTPKAILDERWSLARAFEVTPVTAGGAGALAALLVGGYGVLAYSVGRDRRSAGAATDVAFATDAVGGTPVPLFEDDSSPVEFIPPDGLRPAQYGLILNERVRPVDVSATIVDLAVRGYLRIEEVGEGRKRDFRFVRLRNEAGGLLPYEAALFDALVPPSVGQMLLSDHKDTFASKLSSVMDKVYEDGQARGWYRRRPDRARALWRGIGVGLILVTGTILGLAIWLTHVALLAVPLVLLAFLVFFGAGKMPARTPAGTGLFRRSRGFEIFLRDSEAPRARWAEQKSIFSDYLPYTIVLGCATRWAKTFEPLGDAATAGAVWYVGTHPMGASDLATSSSSFASSAGATMGSTPASSGSSGFSGGGGSSGGGGGGGGGGSW